MQLLAELDGTVYYDSLYRATTAATRAERGIVNCVASTSLPCSQEQAVTAWKTTATTAAAGRRRGKSLTLSSHSRSYVYRSTALSHSCSIILPLELSHKVPGYPTCSTACDFSAKASTNLVY